jgi:2-polyprenyl-6-hydroxyphenyl methylase/3-demethylubiquinone-9 3-methyltransferase
LSEAIVAGGLAMTDQRGVVYNPLADQWLLARDTAVNYMVAAERAPSLQPYPPEDPVRRVP